MERSCAELYDDYKKYPEPYNELILRVIDRMLSNSDEDINDAFFHVMHDQLGWNGTDEEYLEIMLKIQPANFFMRTLAREEILGSILQKKIPIHLYGGGMERILKKYPDNKATYNGGIPFSRMPEIYSDAKIVLNIGPMFKDGCHDRILTAMLYGAAVLTDTNRYIEDVMGDKVFTYTNAESLVEELPNILCNDETISEIAQRGYEYAQRSMTWNCYVNNLLAYIESILNP